MIILLPHQDDELKLIKFQNELAENIYNGSKVVFYRQVPLWIDISDLYNDLNIGDDKINLKKIAGIISSVTIEKLLYNENMIYSLVTIKYIDNNNKSCEFSEKLPLLHKLKRTSIKQNNLNNINYMEESSVIKKFLDTVLEDYEKQHNHSLRIFRIGSAHKPSGNAIAVSDSVWCKLK